MYNNNNMMMEETNKNKIMTGIMTKLQEELLNVVNGGDMHVARAKYESYIEGTKNVLVTEEIDELERILDSSRLTLEDFMYYARLDIDDSRDIYEWLSERIVSLDSDILEINVKNTNNIMDNLGL